MLDTTKDRYEKPDYSVWWWDTAGEKHAAARFITATSAIKLVFRLTNNPLTKRVILTDHGNIIVYEWFDGRTVYPPSKEH